MASQPLGPIVIPGFWESFLKVSHFAVRQFGTLAFQDLPLGGLGKMFCLVIDELELGSTRSLIEVKGVSPLGDEIWKHLLLLGVAWDLFPAPSGLKLFHISSGDGFSFIRWIRFVSI